jgi:hypothetical protein
MGKAKNRGAKGGSSEHSRKRQYRIKGYRRERPDVAKLGKAALELALQQAALESAAEAERQRGKDTGQDDGPERGRA